MARIESLAHRLRESVGSGINSLSNHKLDLFRGAILLGTAYSSCYGMFLTTQSYELGAAVTIPVLSNFVFFSFNIENPHYPTPKMRLASNSLAITEGLGNLLAAGLMIHAVGEQDVQQFTTGFHLAMGLVIGTLLDGVGRLALRSRYRTLN